MSGETNEDVEEKIRHSQDQPHQPHHSGEAPQPESNVPAFSAMSHAELASTEAENRLAKLRRFTTARIALGRTGHSLPTTELLDFGLAHAMARDAVHTPLDALNIVEQLRAADLECVRVHSAAADRAAYLRRPDLGRKLDEPNRSLLAGLRAQTKPEIVFVIADGLSALAPERYAVPVIQAVRELLPNWQLGPVVLAEQARVALGDEVGELLGARVVVMLIGERPGLSSPDSLGIYLTYAPKIGRTDAERNCISNVRAEGMSLAQAARTLHYLLLQSRKLQLSGVDLKDNSNAELSLPPTETVANQQKQIKSS